MNLRFACSLLTASAFFSLPLAALAQYRAQILPMPGSLTSVMFTAIGDGQIVASYPTTSFRDGDAYLYNKSNSNITDFGANVVFYGVGGDKQVGAQTLFSGYYPQAVVWSGTPGSAKNLIPSSDDAMFRGTYAYGTDGIQGVGYGYKIVQPRGDLHNHALLFDVQNGGYIDLNPGTGDSYAFGVKGGQQVGVLGSLGDNPLGNSGGAAVLWTGSANSVVALNPAGYIYSLAYGTDGAHQVGWGNTIDTSAHALLWSGTAASAIDLNPSGFQTSHAYGIANGLVVGVGQLAGSSPFNPGPSHALVWSGSANSVFDLSTVLPTGYTNSTAYGIDAGGDIVGTATNASGQTLPVLWRVAAVPEPGALSPSGLLIITGAGGLLMRRRRLARQAESSNRNTPS